ncbi:MAG: DUF817 family protein [Actinomycetes bacterium]
MKQLVRFVSMPIDPAEALLLWCLGVTLVLWLVRWEAGREVGEIFGFHVVGLALELYEVEQGSWSYPDTGVATIGDVPLSSGFMYAAVGSYVCQAWRRLDLRITGYRARSTASVAALVYLNFSAPTWWPTSGWPWRRRCSSSPGGPKCTVGRSRQAMPLALSFVLIGFFLWIAENAATFLRAWQYPSQESVWTLVHAAKSGSWSLLVVVSIVLVAGVKAYEGRPYGTARERTVWRAHEAPPGPMPRVRPGLPSAGREWVGR